MKTKWPILKRMVSVVVLILAVPISTTKAGDVYWDNGGSYLINDETYKSDWVRLDYNIANDPGTHLDLVDGGIVGMLSTYNNASITMTGGSSDVINCRDNSTISVTGGRTTIVGYNNANIDIAGGIHGTIAAGDYGTINYYADSVANGLSVATNAVANIYGGEIESAGTHDFSIINLYECNMSVLLAYDFSTIYLFGNNLEKYSVGGEFGYGYVTGDWLSGDSFSMDFFTADTHSHIQLVPEPSILSLFTIGFLYLSRRKR